MASYVVARSKTATLIAATADTVQITGKYRRIRVFNHSTTNRITVLSQGGSAPTAPVADADNTGVVPASGMVEVYNDTAAERAISVTPDGINFYIALVSAGTPTYTVVAD